MVRHFIKMHETFAFDAWKVIKPIKEQKHDTNTRKTQIYILYDKK